MLKIKNLENTFLKRVLFIYIFFCVLTLNAQTLKFIDSETLKPISFCEVFINNKIHFSDENGVLKLKDFAVIEISDARFEYQSIDFSMDSIFYLTPNKIELANVLVSNKQFVIENKVKKSSFTNLPKGMEIAYWIDNHQRKMGKMLSIEFKLRNNTSTPAFLKIDFYDEDFQKLNQGNIVIPISALKSGDNSVDVSKNNIIVSSEKFLVSLRIIDNINIFNNDKLKDFNVVFFNTTQKSNALFRINSMQEWNNFQDLNYIPWMKFNVLY